MLWSQLWSLQYRFEGISFRFLKIPEKKFLAFPVIAVRMGIIFQVTTEPLPKSDTGQNRGHTFDNFVQGDRNIWAKAAAHGFWKSCNLSLLSMVDQGGERLTIERNWKSNLENILHGLSMFNETINNF